MIDAATPGDAAAMAQVLGGWVRQTPWMPKLHLPVEDVWFCTSLIDTCAVRVLRLPDVAGFVAWRDRQVLALYLAPAVRGFGHGKALLDLAKSGQQHLELWTFQANTRAIAFYQREGFAEVFRTDGSGNNEKLPDVQLGWTGLIR